TSGGTPTTTHLSTTPATPLTPNQSVTLNATVTADSSPTGTVEFDINGTPIAGCLNRPLIRGGSAGTATCQTTAGTASSDTAAAGFRPANGTALQGSTDATDLVVAKGSTTTTASVSDPAPKVGQNVTYAAAVAPDVAGAVAPTGAVQFLDDGTPIDSCASQPFTPGAPSPTATCTLSYSTAGSHQITAAYLGDDNFAGSTSSEPQTVNVHQASPPPKPSGCAHVQRFGFAHAGRGQDRRHRHRIVCRLRGRRAAPMHARGADASRRARHRQRTLALRGKRVFHPGQNTR
ncbi:MAG: Ig-like domain repeat protein, partial [Solirubrobacteraceae bacterium]